MTERTTAPARPVGATGNTAVSLARVLAKWLYSHCPTAKTILATCLLSVPQTVNVVVSLSGCMRLALTVSELQLASHCALSSYPQST